MFTGLIEEKGVIRAMEPLGQGLRMEIAANRIMDDLAVDASVAVNGCCLTVVRHMVGAFAVDVVEETLKKTTLGRFRVGQEVNLERAMKWSDRLGGHLVLGHVDGVGRILSLERRSASWWVTAEIPVQLTRYVIHVGSIALDGISLTVAEINQNRVAVSIIPHTWEVTCFSGRMAGDPINVEVDMIAKYVEKMFTTPSGSMITEEWLRDRGF